MSIDVLPCSSSVANFVEFASAVTCGQESSQPKTRSQPKAQPRSNSHQTSNDQNMMGMAGTRKLPTKSYDANYVKNTVALAVIARLHQWCCRLFWLTIVCVMSCCGEMNPQSKQKTLQDVRRCIANHKRSKAMSEIEMQLLRHLTNPQSAVLRPTTVRRHKRRPLSRPPSPQLFDICEEVEPLD